ncbi:MAG: ATP-binding protein, partial [Candidatus Omnitrophota bacterium]
YLQSVMSVKLKSIVDIDPAVAEMFLTDRYGGLAAASGKTSDFYQADELWWQKAYREGAGAVFIGDVELDESSGSISIPMAMPVKNNDGAVIGICKESIDVSIFFDTLDSFKLGKTGHAAMVSKTGLAIFHQGIKPLTERLLGPLELREIDKRGVKFMSINERGFGHERNMTVSVAKVRSPFLERNGIAWYVVLSQANAEVFAPLWRFALWMALFFVVLMVAALYLGLVVGERFAEPIHRLHLATEEVMAGNWNREIRAVTGDEIEQFADTFREMITRIRKNHAELVEAKRKLEDFSRTLEKKVEERTSELNRAQEATLNILEDLTAAKDDLEKAMRIKSDFTSMVSHELRTPLGPIKEGAGIILDGLTGAINEEQKDLLSMVKRNADRLSRLINDVLDFQKLESGKMPFYIKPNNIGEVVSEVVGTMNLVAQHKGLQIKGESEPSIPVLMFDRDKITQVLTNLANNAIKFTEAGNITIKAWREGNAVRVMVSDTGPGIRQEDIPLLFQSFQQLGGADDRKIGGTGLGLAISREIIKGHNGKIWVESEIGKGSSFNFLLPIEERRKFDA